MTNTLHSSAMHPFIELSERLDKLFSTGDYSSAHSELTNYKKKYPGDPNINRNEYGILIDIGSGLEDVQLINEGIASGESLLKSDIEETSKAIVHYNIANGYYGLYKLCEHGNSVRVIPFSTFLQKTKLHLRHAIELSGDDKDLSKIFVNLANCFESLGRGAEALRFYDRVLELNPTFSMATRNRAMSLLHFASVSGRYSYPIIVEAYHALRSVVDKEDLLHIGGPASVRTAIDKIAELENAYGEKKLKEPLVHHTIDFTKLSDFEAFYVRFCVENDLFMNFHVHHKNNEGAIDDDVFISVVESLTERTTGISPFDYGQTRAHKLAKFTNQIKEDYATARLLLVQSQFRRSDLDNISQRTLLANCLDYSRFDLYAGLLKASFQAAFNILDKIASFVNSYLELGLDEKSIYFKNKSFWITSGKLRPQIIETDNPALYALYDIYKDFECGEHSRIVSIRNALTHRKITPYSIVIESDKAKLGEEEIEMEELFHKTIDLVRLSKFAVIYLVIFVNIEEQKRIPDGKITLPMQLDTDQYF